MLTGDYRLNESIMAIGAHADDIEIQVGGTLEKYFRRGYQIVYVMSTNNMSGGVSTLAADGTRHTRREPTTDMIQRRKRECDQAAREWNTIPPCLDRKMELIGKHACQMPLAMQPDFGHRIVAQEFGKAAGCGAAEVFTWVKPSAHLHDGGPVYGSLMMELVNNSR